MNIFKKIFFNYIIRDLFNGFIEDDIIRFDEKHLIFYYRNKIMTDKEVESIMSSLKILDINDGYNYLLRDVEWKAQERLFKHSKTDDDAMFSKVAIFIVDSIKNRRLKLLEYYNFYKNGKRIKKIQN